jgi:hypothetical protein
VTLAIGTKVRNLKNELDESDDGPRNTPPGTLGRVEHVDHNTRAPEAQRIVYHLLFENGALLFVFEDELKDFEVIE